MVRKRTVETAPAPVIYVARAVAIAALESIQANLVEIERDARSRRGRIEDMWTRLETETAKGDGLAPRIPLRGLPRWKRQVSSFSMDNVWGNFDDELEHYKGTTAKFLTLLRDETSP